MAQIEKIKNEKEAEKNKIESDFKNLQEYFACKSNTYI